MILKSTNILLLIASICLFGSGCSKPLSIEEYLNRVQNSDYAVVTERSTAGMKIIVTYVPAKAIAIMELMGEDIDERQHEQRANELESYHHLRVRFSPEQKGIDFLKFGSNDPQISHQRLQHLNSFFNTDLTLIDGKDTLPCVLHHFERTYKLTGYGDVSLLFEKQHKGTVSNLQLIYNDQLFQLGELRFNIDSEKIHQLSKLTIN